MSVGESQESLRFSLNAETELDRLADSDMSEDAKWFTVMGNAPLRAVFETALSLPSSFGQLDIDKQLQVFREKSMANFGVDDISDLASEDVRSDLIDRYLLKDQLNQGQSLSSQNIALQLLSA